MTPARERHHLIDAARAAAVLLVIVYHAAFFRVGVADGRLLLERWQPEASWWPATWVLMLLPLFFVAGGFADALSLDAAPAGPSGLTRFLHARGRRISGPLVVFTLVMGGVATTLAWLPGTPPATPYPGVGGGDWLTLMVPLSRDFCASWWFLTVYLVVVALAPLAVRLHDRFSWAVGAVLCVAAAGVDAWSAATGNVDLRYLNWLLVWPACHQWGVAYQRGAFTRGPAWRPWAALVGGAAGVVALIAWAGSPGSAIVSYYPPTVALALLALAQTGLLGLLDRAGVLRTPSPRVARALGRTSGVLMVVYLWGTTAIVAASAALAGVALLTPDAAGALLHPAFVTALALAALAALVPPLARVSGRLTPPRAADPRLGPTLLGHAALTVGTASAWLQGLLLHPGRPGAGVAVVSVLAGAVLLRWAGRPGGGAR